MELLTYAHLDAARTKRQLAKVGAQIARDDWRSAELKKLVGTDLFRVRLDDTNRLLLKFVQYQGRTVCLALEVIHQHAYDKSRFLRGAAVDERKFEAAQPERIASDAAPVRYLHPGRVDFHLQDKVLSFDETQQALYQAPAPLLLVGSAGSGKTALVIEKLRHAPGRVLFVTQSAYLARSARDLYQAHGYSNEAQEVEFLSFAEFLETLEVPPGQEVTFQTFAGWYARQGPAARKLGDAHPLYEEFRGVLSSAADGPLSCEAYGALGIKQSIFPVEQRPAVHALFERYCAWLPTAKLYDSNLVAHAWLARAAPTYDFAVIDEVQDLTPVQLKLILGTLNKRSEFLLCGDSNQIVHPNFFSWARVKSLFWHDPEMAERQALALLAANFRNGQEVTRVANALLKIKHARFGSIDRESNYLVRATSEEAGGVELRADTPQTRASLDKTTRRSTRYAVVVLRDADKAAAKQVFRTPLVFSVQEAKGLEYPNVILVGPVSNHRSEFAEICAGVDADDMGRTTLEYSRARDKSDKSLEIYKFFINALYVAVTRAVERVLWLEADVQHPVFGLLDLRPDESSAQTAPEQASSREDWEREAARLEEQGKREQAEAIRSDILHMRKVPWQPWTRQWAAEEHAKMASGKVMGGKVAQHLFNFALWHGHTDLMEDLSATHSPASQCCTNESEAWRQYGLHRSKVLAAYSRPKFKGILSECEQYGVDMMTQVDATPLMLAALAGNVPLLDALLERGAKVEAVDSHGQNAGAHALQRARADASYARGPFAAVWERVHPRHIDVQVDGRLVRLLPHQAEYFLLTLMLSGYKCLQSALFDFEAVWEGRQGFNVDWLSINFESLPSEVWPPERQRRTYMNSVLARAERNSQYAPARRLWQRKRQGYYMLNPTMHLRRANAQGETEWVPVQEALAQHITSAATLTKRLERRAAQRESEDLW